MLKKTWKWNSYSSLSSSLWYPRAKSPPKISAVKISVNPARFWTHTMFQQKIFENIKCNIFAAVYSPSEIVAILFLATWAHFLSNFSVQQNIKFSQALKSYLYSIINIISNFKHKIISKKSSKIMQKKLILCCAESDFFSSENVSGKKF